MARWWDDGAIIGPAEAFPAGNDLSGPMYICRAEHEGDLIPGKLMPGIGAFVSHNGSEHRKDNYQVLVASPGRSFAWQKADGRNPPIEGAIVAGNTASGEALYIARVEIDGVQACGKFHPSHQKAYIPYGNSEHAFDTFDILVLI